MPDTCWSLLAFIMTENHLHFVNRLFVYTFTKLHDRHISSSYAVHSLYAGLIFRVYVLYCSCIFRVARITLIYRYPICEVRFPIIIIIAILGLCATVVGL